MELYSFTWIKKVIRSCNSTEHYQSAQRLIENYKKLYQETRYDLCERLQHFLEKQKNTKEIQ